MAWFEYPGGRVYYDEVGEGEPVLLLPGFSLNLEDVSMLRDAFRSHHRVISADLPGSGRSEPQPRQYTRHYHADDARVFLALLTELAIDRVHLVGHSDGGETSLVMAALDSARVRSVTTWGALGFIDRSLEPLLIAFEVVVDEPIDALRDYSEYLKATYGEENARAMVRSFVRATREIIADGGDIARRYVADINCPVMLITGDHDPFAPPNLLARFAATIPTAEVRNLPDAGHDLHRKHTDWLVETSLEWIGRN